jgi:hypothetical protein
VFGVLRSNLRDNQLLVEHRRALGNLEARRQIQEGLEAFSSVSDSIALALL